MTSFAIYLDLGRLPFAKKFGNFLLGISVWEKRVPIVTSPILRRPGRLRVLERHGTGDKTGNLLMSVPQRNERKRGLAGMQRDKAPVEWPRSEGGGTRRCQPQPSWRRVTLTERT